MRAGEVFLVDVWYDGCLAMYVCPELVPQVWHCQYTTVIIDVVSLSHSRKIFGVFGHLKTVIRLVT